ncbi:MAG: amidohydrolase family protein [Actinomycetota bacterium]
MSLVLKGATLVTSLEPPTVAVGDLVVDDGRVVSVGGPAPEADALDCTGCVVIPGNVVAHHHLYSSLARGMPYRLDPPRTFLQVLQRVWWRLDLALDPESVWLSAWSGGADALLAGTTTIVDHHASPNAIEGSLERVASALEELGVRSVLCYEVTDRDGPERAAAGLEEHRAFAKVRGSRSTAMVGAHASFTLSNETLAACVDLASELDTGIHIHVAEDEADERDAAARSGWRVVERLADAGALTDRSLLAHCVHIDQHEATLIHAAGAWVAHNPRSNMNNRVGRAPVAALGNRLTLGTDGIDGDLFAESRTAYWRAREADASIGPEWAVARVAASARLAGAASGEPLLGRIEPGAPADLVVLAYDPPTPLTSQNLGGHWVFGLTAAHVRDVLVHGEVVVRDRQLTRVDAADVRARCREAAGDLWTRIDGIPAHPFEPEGAGA